ncbi:MAG: TRAP transporter large permease subunit [Alphaproteobacteria bacterium]|nr:TRAP transporter large permease subunit [Alphaproteobacteria bacterium]
MQNLEIAGLLILLMFAILGSGVWIGLALLGTGWIAMELFTSRPVGPAMVTTIWGASSSWTLTALPMFIWMGEILFRTRLSQDLFRGLAPWMQRLPGRLLHTNVIGCTIFAAISGSSAATCATIGKMSIPELRRRGYPEGMIVGSLAGSGTLGLLIPPSLIMIVYGVQTNTSIAQLFIAGVVPGLALAGLFMAWVILWSMANADRIPAADMRMTLFEKIHAARFLLPSVGLIVLVLGSIYAGYATATEAAAVGVAGALLVATLQGDMSRQVFVESLMGATRLSCMIAFILAGAAFLTLAMGFTGLPRALAEWIDALDLGPGMLILILTVFYSVLGCFLDGISMVVLTMAVVMPTIERAGFDLVWFGIFVVIVVEMAQITPPVGFNLFVLQGMTGHQITYIGWVAFPFFLLMCLMVALLFFVPDLALWLPRKMM